MSDVLTVAVDGMGGDDAPEMIIAGLDMALRRMGDARFLLFGDEEKLIPLLETYPSARQACQVRHTTEAIAGHDKPTTALRMGKNSSMRLAIDAVAKGEAQAIVSAGNTGALMAMATIVIKRLPGINRPAIATSFPTQRGKTVMLDLGANIECDASNLVQFAVMGEVFARNELNLSQPSIGILNVGVEGLKGNEHVRKASTILRESDLPIKFYGFVEGDDLGAGTVDVIVTDGFTGNIALKIIEGTVRLFSQSLKEALRSSLLARLGMLLASPSLGRLRSRFDPRDYNGAILLGLNGICVKSHGSTDARGFANAIQVAVNMVRSDFNERIKEDLGHLISEYTEPQSAAV